MTAIKSATSSEIETVEVKQLERELQFLLRRYARSSSQALAERIYLRMEGLLPYLDELGFMQDRCAFYRLLRSWRLRAKHPENGQQA